MNCRVVMDKIYDAWGEEDSLSILCKTQIAFHIFFCKHCASETKKLEIAQSLLEKDFFPETFSYEDRVMERIYVEELESMDTESTQGVSFRSWVITGFVILISLTTSFFGVDFIKVATSQGSSFLLPVGITIGCIVTAYGAMFIGSHLKELSEWLKLPTSRF